MLDISYLLHSMHALMNLWFKVHICNLPILDDNGALISNYLLLHNYFG